jgi:hypothetical protein
MITAAVLYFALYKLGIGVPQTARAETGEPSQVNRSTEG